MLTRFLCHPDDRKNLAQGLYRGHREVLRVAQNDTATVKIGYLDKLHYCFLKKNFHVIDCPPMHTQYFLKYSFHNCPLFYVSSQLIFVIPEYTYLKKL